VKRTLCFDRRELAWLVFFAFAGGGCEPAETRVETGVLPSARAAETGDRLPPAYHTSQDKVNDPRLLELAGRLKDWALMQRVGPNGLPIFSRVEVLPPTQTVLPYGVGAFQQEPRLPAILTTGHGWVALKPEEKEERVAAAFGEISNKLDALKIDSSPRPTLTIQMPNGLVLGWINDLTAGRKNLHGDEQ